MAEIWELLYSKSAPFKVFLTANVEERAQRRLKQLHDNGIAGILSQTLEEVKKER